MSMSNMPHQLISIKTLLRIPDDTYGNKNL